MDNSPLLASPSPALPEPEAVAGALGSALTRWTSAERPTLLLIGNDPGAARLAAALGESVVVSVASFVDLPVTGSWDLSLCLGLPEIDWADAARLARRLAGATERLLLAPLYPQAGPGDEGERLQRWLGVLVDAGLLYDIDGAAALPPLLHQMNLFCLRRATIQKDAAPGYLTLALHDQARMLAGQRALAAEQEAQISLLTALSLDLERSLATISSQRRRLDQALGEVNSNWTALQDSPGFGLLQSLQRVRAQWAPAGSRRERLLEMVIGWLRIVGRRGLPGLAAHFRGELAWRTKAVTGFVRRRDAPELVEIQPVRRRPAVGTHQASVEIIICIHNALAHVQRCLDSVVRHTSQPYGLILVDDGSAAATRDYLVAFVQRHPRATLLRNEDAAGYTMAANRGLRQSSADFVVLLNSDTVVTQGWLDRMIGCAEAGDRVGMVGPLANTASWQSVPEIAIGDDWADNPLPAHMDLDSWAARLAERSGRLFPPMSLLNGFCLLIRRAVIEEIGLFDEATFGAGYGEENDYCLRARDAGWQLALADDTYIFHAQSRSYSDERRRQLSQRAAEALEAKHGKARIEAAVDYCRESPVLAGMRARAAVLGERTQILAQGRRQFGGRRLLFLLPADSPGGGANVVIAESRAMQQMGVEVALFNEDQHRAHFAASYPGLDIPVHFGRAGDVAALAAGYDAVVATWHSTVFWMQEIDPNQHRLGYYVQDYEPYFFPEGSAERRLAIDSYTALPQLRLFTKTAWNQQELLAQAGVHAAVVGPSVEIDHYRPRPLGDWDAPPRPLHVVAMVRPHSARRSPQLTMHLLRRLSHRYGEQIQITVFGVKANDPGLAALPQDFRWRLAGVLDPDRVAALLAQTDIFVDFSTYQAMGLTALEAMAAGVAVIVPQCGGATSFARAEENALVVDTASEAACWSALVRLVEDEALRRRLRRRAIFDVCRFHPEGAAYQILCTLFDRPGGAP